MDRRRLLFYISLLVSFSSAARKRPFFPQFARKDSVLEIYKWESCNVSWNQAVCSNFKVNTAKNYRTHDVDIYYKTTCSRIGTVLFNIKRCKDAVSFNTCEHFAVWKYSTDPCAVLNDDKTFWSPVIRASDPPYRCPFKGDTTYRIRNFTIDFDLLKILNLPVFESVWSFEVRTTDKSNKDHSCIYVQARALNTYPNS